MRDSFARKFHPEVEGDDVLAHITKPMCCSRVAEKPAFYYIVNKPL